MLLGHSNHARGVPLETASLKELSSSYITQCFVLATENGAERHPVPYRSQPGHEHVRFSDYVGTRSHSPRAWSFPVSSVPAANTCN